MFAERLLLLRKEANETQKELAEALDASQPTIFKWESGQYQPDINLLRKISSHYNVTIDYLVGNTGIRQGTIPKELRHPITADDVKKYEDFVRNAANAYFWNDKIAEEDKRSLIELMTKDFWDSLMKLKDKKE